jgi:hypothetical protein
LVDERVGVDDVDGLALEALGRGLGGEG